MKEYRKINSQGICFAKGHENVIKADWNESGFGIAPKVKEELIKFIIDGPMHWYPDINGEKLKEAIRNYLNIDTDNIQLFNGSDEALDFISRAFIAKNDLVAIVEPTYDQFRFFAEVQQGDIYHILNQDIFSQDLDFIIQNLKPSTKIVYLVNPNNPTGVYYQTEEIKRLIEAFPGTIFILDEAYIDFSKKTSAGLIENHGNLIIARTFSKLFGLAGLRIGYLLGEKSKMDRLNLMRNPKNVNAFGQYAALKSLENIDYYLNVIQESNDARDWTVDELKSHGFEAYNTPANFFLVKVDNPAGLITHLEKSDIFVRDRSYLPGMEGMIRISVHPKSKMEIIVKKIMEYKDEI